MRLTLECSAEYAPSAASRSGSALCLKETGSQPSLEAWQMMRCRLSDAPGRSSCRSSIFLRRREKPEAI